jgi:hypothetical protein
MQSHSHPVDKAPIGHEVLSCAECMFMQFSGRIFRTMKDPDA